MGRDKSIYNVPKCVKCKESFSCNCRISCGCQKCKNECYFPSLEEVKDDIERINNFLFNKGQAYAQYLKFGYNKVSFENVISLSIYLETLERLYDYLYRRSKGFKEKIYYCPSDYTDLKSEVNSIIGIVKVEVFNHFKDDSGVELFMLSNPNMVSFDRWKKYLYNFETQYEIKVEKVKNSDLCDSVVYHALKLEKKDCNTIMSSLKSVKKCLAGFKVDIDESLCAEKYQVLVKDKTCNIEYRAYKLALKCGFTDKSIKSLYKCGGFISADKSNNKCYVSISGSPSVECNLNNIKSIINKIECVNIH